MRLVSCPACHVQFDVTGESREEIQCPCGEVLRVVAPVPVDVEVRRCSSCGASLGPDEARCEYCRSPVVRDEERLLLICPECYARNPEDSSFCTGCGVEFRPQAVPEDGAAPSCPCCEREMRVRGIGGVLVHECPGCSGLWAPGDSFENLVERAARAGWQGAAGTPGGAGGRSKREREFQGDVVYRLCPVCGGHMQRKNFGRRSGVIVDWCGMHGTWLDADELEQIAAFIAEGGLEREKVDAAHERARNERHILKMRAERARRAASGCEAPGTITARTLGDLLEGLLGW